MDLVKHLRVRIHVEEVKVSERRRKVRIRRWKNRFFALLLKLVLEVLETEIKFGDLFSLLQNPSKDLSTQT